MIFLKIIRFIISANIQNLFVNVVNQGVKICPMKKVFLSLKNNIK